jgi:hypothetical protein
MKRTVLMATVKREMKSGIHAIYAQQNVTEIPLKV